MSRARPMVPPTATRCWPWHPQSCGSFVFCKLLIINQQSRLWDSETWIHRLCPECAWHGGDLLSHEERGWLMQVHRASPASPFQKFTARLWRFLILPWLRGKVFLFPGEAWETANWRGHCIGVEEGFFCSQFGDLPHKSLISPVIMLIRIHYPCQHHSLLQA